MATTTKKMLQKQGHFLPSVTISESLADEKTVLYMIIVLLEPALFKKK